MDDLDLIITGRVRAQEWLRSSRRKPNWCISIGGPLEAMPSGLRRMPRGRALRLEFDDVSLSTIRNPPTMVDVERLVAFCKQISGGRVLVHCQAGISRSTASAFVLLCIKLGHGREEEAARQVLEAQPDACPNPLIVRYADELLGRDGAMLWAMETM